MGRKNTKSNAKDLPKKGDQLRLSDVAYQRVLEGLFNRTIQAGSFVSQAELVEKIGVPVQPLRDALRILEAEGVLSVHPRSGIEFLKPDLELARSTYQFRAIIERAAARHCAAAGEIDHFAKLIDAHEDLKTRITAGDFGANTQARIADMEEQLHGGMLDSLNNPLVTTTAGRLKNYVQLIKLERLITPPLVLQSLDEHIVILRAIVVRDSDAAEAALVAHFQASLQRILGMF